MIKWWVRKVEEVHVYEVVKLLNHSKLLISYTPSLPCVCVIREGSL